MKDYKHHLFQRDVFTKASVNPSSPNRRWPTMCVYAPHKRKWTTKLLHNCTRKRSFCVRAALAWSVKTTEYIPYRWRLRPRLDRVLAVIYNSPQVPFRLMFFADKSWRACYLRMKIRRAKCLGSSSNYGEMSCPPFLLRSCSTTYSNGEYTHRSSVSFTRLLISALFTKTKLTVLPSCRVPSD